MRSKVRSYRAYYEQAVERVLQSEILLASLISVLGTGVAYRVWRNPNHIRRVRLAAEKALLAKKPPVAARETFGNLLYYAASEHVAFLDLCRKAVGANFKAAGAGFRAGAIGAQSIAAAIAAIGSTMVEF